MSDVEAAASPMFVDRGLVWDAGLHTRHTAAMHLVKRGEDDRVLLLSYVIWPTEMIDTTLMRLARRSLDARSVDARRDVWR